MCYQRCRKKERMENENESCLRWDSNPQHSVLGVQMLYQLSYQGSSAGRVQIKHLIRLYEPANMYS